jgi:hypothetical protein
MHRDELLSFFSQPLHRMSSTKQRLEQKGPDPSKRRREKESMLSYGKGGNCAEQSSASGRRPSPLKIRQAELLAKRQVFNISAWDCELSSSDISLSRNDLQGRAHSLTPI